MMLWKREGVRSGREAGGAMPALLMRMSILRFGMLAWRVEMIVRGPSGVDMSARMV